MDMPKPTPAHHALQKMAGNWVGQEKLGASPWDPQGGTATGRATNRVALDGFAIVQDYEQERNGAISFRGHGVITYDAVENCYVMHWVDSMGTPPNIFKGDFSNDVLTLTCNDPQMTSKAIFEFTGPNSYKFRMDVTQDGQKWHNFMEGTYTKK